ncbi:cysteine--tRNA ligase [Pseudonocardia spinosispora]|uniref:cysteine--tRNA ligase n=1 Tax=Pseudonocardia spinosispora TaxID=103441 RepID=UPI0004900144|nr:cysteine--tRNA ligase [Pseudonocardia spinosispora]
MTPLPAGPRCLTLGGQALPLISPARVYLCGITPYDVTHLGHAATFVWADAATSIMRMAGVEVLVCRNVTDIDDVLTIAAAERETPYDVLAATQEYLFDQDMTALRVRPPTYTPRARRHVDRVIELAAALLESGHGYLRDGQVYFRGFPAIPGGVPADADEHGELTGDHTAREPHDVAVWRSSGPDEPAWPSPWGLGRPGWHAECAAIALSVLGSSVDLVAGGADLAFPHHAYQAALVEAATGVRPFARSRLNVGTVGIGGEKMAKSTGNLVLVADLLREHSPAAIRLLLLDRDWREPWDFHPADLTASAARLDRIYSAAGTRGEEKGSLDAVTSALLRELDVPTALDIAEEAGGDAARLVLRTLALA